MPSLQECQRIKSLGRDVNKLIRGYKGLMCSNEGNRCLDLLDDAMSAIAELEQKAFDGYRAEAGKGGER